MAWLAFLGCLVVFAAGQGQNCPNVDGYPGYQQRISQGGGVTTAGGPNGVWKFAFNLCGPLTLQNNCASAKPGATPLWACQSYDPNVGKVMAAGNNNVPPNANPTPGTWTVTPFTSGEGLIFTATGGDASSSNPGCFLSIQVAVTCDRGGSDGITNAQFQANSACPNTPFTFTAKSASACKGPPPPPPGGVLFGTPRAGLLTQFGFQTDQRCRAFVSMLAQHTTCDYDAAGCNEAALTVTLKPPCRIPGERLRNLHPSYYAYVGPAAVPVCPYTGSLCFDSSMQVSMSYVDTPACFEDFGDLVVHNAAVTQACTAAIPLIWVRARQPPQARLEAFASLDFTQMNVTAGP